MNPFTLFPKLITFIISIAFAGSLVDTTISMMHKAAKAHEVGRISYSNWTNVLLKGSTRK